uniref:Uncharacterized protein n=1 Tax=Rhizophora mucronata TaxID=61149 RepID=A0A2P2N220_RHIMU
MKVIIACRQVNRDGFCTIENKKKFQSKWRDPSI